MHEEVNNLGPNLGRKLVFLLPYIDLQKLNFRLVGMVEADSTKDAAPYTTLLFPKNSTKACRFLLQLF